MKRLTHVLFIVVFFFAASSVFAGSCDQLARLEYAAKLGIPEYEYKLANCYMQSADDKLRKEGVEWLELAAANGLPEAAYDIAKRYRAGDLVERDLMTACAYFVVSTDALPVEITNTAEFKRRLNFYRTKLSPVDQLECDRLADDFAEDTKLRRRELTEKERLYPNVYRPFAN